MNSKRRQRKIDKLISQGFTTYEARELSSIKKYPPYVVAMIASRSSRYQRAIKQGTSRNAFYRQIRDEYVRLGYTKTRTVAGRPFKDKKIRIDFWKNLRAWEDSFKRTHKDYDEKYKKGGRKLKDFDDRDLLKRPGE